MVIVRHGVSSPVESAEKLHTAGGAMWTKRQNSWGASEYSSATGSPTTLR